MFPYVVCNYNSVLEYLAPQILYARWQHLDALFLINICNITKFCPSILETVDIHVPAQNIHNFSIFNCSSSHYPSGRCAPATGVIFRKLYFALNDNRYIIFIPVYIILMRGPILRCLCGLSLSGFLNVVMNHCIMYLCWFFNRPCGYGISM